MRPATMADASGTAVSQADHAVLYEDWLLKYRKVTDRFDEDSKRNQQKEDGENVLLGKLTAEAVAVRAGRMGDLQCAVKDAKADDVDAVRKLMNQVQMQVERDATSVEQMKALDTMIPKFGGTQRLPLQSVEVDVDGFFEEFPECVRSDWNDPESESEDDDDEDDDDRKERDSKRKKRPRSADTNRQQDVPPPPQPETREMPQQRPTTAARPNPYAVRPRQETANLQQQNANQYNTVDLSTTTTNRQNVPTQTPPFHQSYPDPQSRPVDLTTTTTNHQNVPPPQTQPFRQSYPRPGPGPPPSAHQRRAPPPPPPPNPSMQGSRQAWDDHQSKNPFQSAREYAWAEDGAQKKENKGAPTNPQQHQYRQPPQQHQQQHQPQPPGGYHNPYANTAPGMDHNNNNPPPDQPIIRDSLKRKFQIPKRGASNETQNKGGDSRGKSNGSAPPRGGGMSARPPAANDSSNNNEDEDDLPEELKRFGKDLVEKIENEIMDSGDPVTFQDIAGLADAKQTVQEVVCWPMKRPDLFTGLRRAPNGLLLYGPPGTGKTLIGKAIAYESGATFFSISSSSLTSKWIGEGEKLVRTLFAVAAYREPAVVFIDEIDSLLTQRKADENEASRRIKTEFLVQLDGTGTSNQGRVLMIGATNRPQELDEAARRRFTKRLYIPLPEELDRELLLRVLLGKNNHRLVDADIKKLAKETAGFSGADLKSLSTDAAMGPIRQLGARALEVDVQDVPPISYKHFRQALRGMRPSVAPADLLQYLEWDRLFGSKRAEPENDSDDTDEDEEAVK